MLSHSSDSYRTRGREVFRYSRCTQKLEDNNQVLFRYCAENGSLSDKHNPNGSLNNIAGICNAGQNVFGMMPHPERASEDILGNTEGRLLFESLIEASKKASVEKAIA